jgi:predicted amidophosphoribosyltransferase
LNISQVPVCADCLRAIDAIGGKACSDCGERVLSSYPKNRYALKARHGKRMILKPDIRRRTRATQSQIGLTSPQPRENMQGASAVAHAAELSGREALVGDDLYTTGTTAAECAKVLRRAGTRKAGVATVVCTLNSASKYEGIPEGFKVSESQVFRAHRILSRKRKLMTLRP